ncbi:unnamed protein product [Commensalibacter communis]|uniref:hypothetical protein n=1 Tax=Commensalibacter communis TaxID=2972786 RepID=UPI0022FF7395|nr:hypothetical protein [Commensalibacter communis]CAI3959330.1 unnamed protein product [Commensalibacter communis]
MTNQEQVLPEARTIPLSSLWENDTTYYFDSYKYTNNTQGIHDGKNVSKNDKPKLYAGPGTESDGGTGAYYLEQNQIPVTDPFYNISSMTVFAGSAQYLEKKQDFKVKITYFDGSTTELTVKYKGYQDSNTSLLGSKATSLVFQIVSSDNNNFPINRQFVLAPAEQTNKTLRITNIFLNTGLPPDIKCFLKGTEIETVSGKKKLKNYK